MEISYNGSYLVCGCDKLNYKWIVLQITAKMFCILCHIKVAVVSQKSLAIIDSQKSFLSPTQKEIFYYQNCYRNARDDRFIQKSANVVPKHSAEWHKIVQLSNSSICLSMNYSVLNEMKRNE